MITVTVLALALSMCIVAAAPTNPIRRIQAVQHKGIQRLHTESHTLFGGPSLINNGGPVISKTVVHPLFYGDAKYQSDLEQFYASVTQSPWYDILGQYNAQRGSAVAGKSIPGANLTYLEDVHDIQPLLISLIESGKIKPTKNSYFPIHFAPGISIRQGHLDSCVQFCGYHGTVDVSSLNIGLQYLYYGVIPDQDTGSCSGGCGTDPSSINNLFAVSSHELAEAVTDAAVGVNKLAWYDQYNGEIGDICNGQQDTTVGGDGQTYVIQQLWSNAAGSCVAQ